MCQKALSQIGEIAKEKNRHVGVQFLPDVYEKFKLKN